MAETGDRADGENDRHRIVVVGGGSWGTAIARNVALKAAEEPRYYSGRVTLWLRDEKVEGKYASLMLSAIMNETHVNVKYLPGINLPHNLVVEPDLAKAAHEATLVIFAVPQQFIHRALFVKILSGCSPNVRFLSLVKGLSFKTLMNTETDPVTQVSSDVTQLVPTLVSQQIRTETHGASTSVLMGANIASQVARDEFCEATIGISDAEDGEVWFRLLNRPHFRVNVVMDVEGVELCGGLRFIVALGAGFCDGAKLGSNSKAAVVRIGLEELRRFGTYVFSAKDATFFESCGVGDLMTSSYSPNGRNRRCAEAFVTTHKGQSWEAIEAKLLDGQALGDLNVLRDLIAYLRSKGVASTKYPLFSKIHAVAFEGAAASEIVTLKERRKWRSRSKYPAFSPASAVVAALAIGVSLGFGVNSLATNPTAKGMVQAAYESAAMHVSSLIMPSPEPEAPAGGKRGKKANRK